MLYLTVAEFEHVILEDRPNSLLNRHEVRVIFKNSAGRIKRREAAELIAHERNTDKKLVIPVRMKCGKGKTDVQAVFYVYANEDDTRKHLPRYMHLRSLPKDDRKKIIADEKAAKLKAIQSTAAESKAQGRGGGKK
jgi:small subunit ribosomal protein S24e